MALCPGLCLHPGNPWCRTFLPPLRLPPLLPLLLPPLQRGGKQHHPPHPPLFTLTLPPLLLLLPLP